MAGNVEELMAPLREIASEKDCGLEALVLLARFHGVAADPHRLKHEFGRGAEPANESDLLLAARSLELKAKVVATPVADSRS